MSVFKQQYELIKANREVVFEFMEGISLEKLHEAVPGFGINNMIEAHIHAADSYRYWFGDFVFQMNPADMEVSEDEIKHADVKKAREIFAAADELVERFLNEYGSRLDDPIERKVEWSDKPVSFTPLFILTHVETHEFHHRGQMVSMARHLGCNSSDDRLGSLFA